MGASIHASCLPGQTRRKPDREVISMTYRLIRSAMHKAAAKRSRSSVADIVRGRDTTHRSELIEIMYAHDHQSATRVR